MSSYMSSQLKREDLWFKKQVDLEETFDVQPDCPLQVWLVIVSY